MLSFYRFNIEVEDESIFISKSLIERSRVQDLPLLSGTIVESIITSKIISKTSKQCPINSRRISVSDIFILPFPK